VKPQVATIATNMNGKVNRTVANNENTKMDVFGLPILRRKEIVSTAALSGTSDATNIGVRSRNISSMDSCAIGSISAHTKVTEMPMHRLALISFANPGLLSDLAFRAFSNTSPKSIETQICHGAKNILNC